MLMILGSYFPSTGNECHLTLFCMTKTGHYCLTTTTVPVASAAPTAAASTSMNFPISMFKGEDPDPIDTSLYYAFLRSWTARKPSSLANTSNISNSEINMFSYQLTKSKVYAAHS